MSKVNRKKIPMPKVKQIKTVILGAGLAGLSASYHGGGAVFEKEKEIGGTCRSLSNNGFVFDLGIHVLHSRNRYILNLLKKSAALGLLDKRRSAWIFSYGTLTKYPFQVNTYGLPQKIIHNCLAGFKSALKHKQPYYHNYEDWIYGNFGKGIADNFYLPYSEKFWTVKAKELTTDWLDVRVPCPRLDQVIAGARFLQKEEFGPNAKFRYPRRKGIQSIAYALIKKSTKVLLGKEANLVEIEKRMLHFKDKTSVSFNKLISTIPLPELFKIINIAPCEVKEAANGLRYNSVLCVNLAIKRKELTSKHWIYFPEEKYAPFRISFPRNFSRFTTPGEWSSVQAEISYSKSKPIRHRDIIEKVIRDLIKAKVIKPNDRVKFLSKHDVKYAYVIYDQRRLDNLKIINNFLQKNNIYTAGRYGKWEYLWMDGAILSGKNILSQTAR